MQQLLRYLLGLVFIITFAMLCKTIFLHTYPDFSVDYYGVRDTIHGLNPYAYHKYYFAPFIIPPFCLVLFLPFVFFSLSTASHLWTILSIGMLLISIFFILRLYKQKLFSSTSLFLYSLTFMYFPTKFTLGMGEINMLILLCMSIYLYAREKQPNNYLAGVSLGLAYMVKLFPIFLIPLFIIKQQWRMLFILSMTIVVAVGITAIFIRPPVLAYFLQQILPGLLGGWRGDYYNQALSGFITRDIINKSLWLPLKITLSALLLTPAVFIILRTISLNKQIQHLQISIVIILNLLLNTFSWQHHFVWLLIPLLITFFFIKSFHFRWRYYGILATSYILTAINLPHPAAVPLMLQSHVFYGALILYLLDMHLLVKIDSQLAR